MKGLFCAPCQNLAYSQSPAFRPLIVCRICGWGSLCICACAYKIQRCDDKMQEYRKKNLFFPFMLVRHEVCVWFTSRQPCHTALKNSIWCESLYTSAQWCSTMTILSWIHTATLWYTCTPTKLLGWLGRDQSQSGSWTRRCALMMGLLCYGNKCSSMVVISFWGEKYHWNSRQ